MVIPRLKDAHPEVAAAALKAVRQIAVPGQARQYMEVELCVQAATELPKKDRFGACDGYVVVRLRNKPSGRVVDLGRTECVWQNHNPVWKKTFHQEVWDPKPSTPNRQP